MSSLQVQAVRSADLAAAADPNPPDDPAPVAEWLPYLADCLGARPRRRVPVWLARLAVGEVGISVMTEVRGASNAKAKRLLGCEPLWRSWRDGFRDGLVAEQALSAA